jgi:hypothetical protein
MPKPSDLPKSVERVQQYRVGQYPAAGLSDADMLILRLLETPLQPPQRGPRKSIPIEENPYNPPGLFLTPIPLVAPPFSFFPSSS